MSKEQIDQIKKVFRVAVKGGFQFTDQSCNILRKCATRPYRTMAICESPSWTNSLGKLYPAVLYTTFSLGTAKPSHHTHRLIKVIQIEEPGSAAAPQFVVNGIVNEGWADSAIIAGEKTGAKLVDFRGTKMTFEGDQTKFQQAYDLIIRGELP